MSESPRVTLQFPWQLEYQAAMFELDPARLAERVCRRISARQTSGRYFSKSELLVARYAQRAAQG